ncbi:GNAT family N-acetyltransferase [Acidisphaera sp. L21]|jgi:GNAT superfamily N-acetyltransferase|uniref:GNAT family N-acetyltransferase n=1 Tax=Acidisphaera sp. L21 TaxID=1641851 RepID=UPI00131EAA2B|nr:GNAT family N-acetyltransferase [Acidisphaera sp. L21]
MTGWTVALERDPPEDVRLAILKPLLAHNNAQTGDGKYSRFAVTVRAADGEVAGGLFGHIWHNHLFIELLALGAARGEGLARQVMALAEAEARRKGCTGIWLDTFTFQAPGFYAKLGYVEFGRITDYPPGFDRIYLRKSLD